MRLSVVLTVYNKEQFLRRAFESLLNQTEVNVDDYEILVVNDGSTDGSSDIINEFEEKDARIRVLTQKNQGLSMARNNGTDAAKGDYVWYVDADDVISSKSVRLICDAIVTQADVIPMYAETEGEEGVRNQIPINCKTGKDIILSEKWQPCGVFYVFRRSFLKEYNLRFLSGIYHEDAEFTPRMLYQAKTVKVVPEVLYTVVHEPNSITMVPRPKRAFDYLTVAHSINSFIVNHNEVGTDIGMRLDVRICRIINNSLSVISKNPREEQRKYNRILDSSKHLFRALRTVPIMKYRIEGALFKLFPGHYVRVYKLMKFLG